MEHRISIRYDVRLTVGIYHRGAWVETCQTKDISSGGMFLHTRPGPIKRNSLIEVTFDKPGIAGVKCYRLPSLVVHGAKGGIGVMFRSQNTDAHAALKQLIVAESESCSYA